MSIETEPARPSDPPSAEQPPPATAAPSARAAAPVNAPPAGAGNRLYVLDLLRFAAAIALVGYHYIPSSVGAWAGDDAAFGAAGKAVLQYGWLGVETFFVPSVDSVYWTLFVELKLYLLFAIVVRFGVTYRRVVLFCLLWTVVALFSMYTGSAFLNAIVEPFYAPLFVAGITLYLIHRFGPDLLLWCMLGTSIAKALSCLAQRDPVKRGIASYPVTAAVMLVVFAVMVAVALGWFSWVRWRGLVTVGALTYPVYLLHHRIGLAAIERLHDRVPPWILLAAVVVGVLLLGYATHRLVERPLMSALRRGLGSSFARIRAADANSSGSPP